jgi:hypothetical protein
VQSPERQSTEAHQDDGCHSDPKEDYCLVPMVQTLASLPTPSLRHLQSSYTGWHHLQTCGAGSAGFARTSSHGYHPKPCTLQVDDSSTTDQEVSGCRLKLHEMIGRQTKGREPSGSAEGIPSSMLPVRRRLDAQASQPYCIQGLGQMR